MYKEMLRKLKSGKVGVSTNGGIEFLNEAHNSLVTHRQ